MGNTLTLEQFAKKLSQAAIKAPSIFETQFSIMGGKIAQDAKDLLGHYHRQNTGPFKEWEELKNSTKRERKYKGFSENDPLLRTGELRDSISFTVTKTGFVVGSTSKVAVWQEKGTTDYRVIPPRSFLGLAMYRNLGYIFKNMLKSIHESMK